jgi:hypothetical protein
MRYDWGWVFLYPTAGAKIEPQTKFCSNCGKATSLAAAKNNDYADQRKKDEENESGWEKRTALGYAGIVLLLFTAFMTAIFLLAAFGSNAPVTTVLIVLVAAVLFFMLSGLMINKGHKKKNKI